MSGKQLLLALGDVELRYYEEAEWGRFDEGQRIHTLRKPLLIAAMLSLIFLMAGCCAWLGIRMEILKIGQQKIPVETSEQSTQETRTLEVLSLQGIQDTDCYRAGREWLAFTQSYTPKPTAGWDSGEDYWAYSLQDETMVEKLEEVCRKYGLKIIGKPWHEHIDCYAFLELMGVDHLGKTGAPGKIEIPMGRFFAGGSFTIYGNLTLPEGKIPFTYHCVKKDVFYDVFAYVEPDRVSQRNYVTRDGVVLLLLESETSGMVLAEREDCFLTLGLDAMEGIPLETIAEQFDFTIQTKAMDPQQADAREQASREAAGNLQENRFVRDTYAEYLEDLQYSVQEKRTMGFESWEIPEYEYAFYDLDGNGTQELLICSEGYINSVVGWKDGKTDEGKSYRLTLCQGNVLIQQDDYLDGKYYHIFRFANDGQMVFSNSKEQSIVRLKEKDGVWWKTSSTDHYAEFDTVITEEEAREILNSYPKMELDTKPIEEFRDAKGN